jgi:peptidoglycan hydrolase CwlO-like protein
MEKTPLEERYSAPLTRRASLKLLLAVGSFAAVSGSPLTALADTSSDLAAAQKKYNEAQSQLNQIAADYESISEQLSQTQGSIDTIQTKISDLDAQIADLESDLEVKQERLAKTVSANYKDGSHGVVDIFLGAESVEELISNLRSYDAVTSDTEKLIAEVKQERQSLQDNRAELEAQKADMETARVDQQAQLEQMQAKQDEAQQLVSGLDQQVKDLIAKRDAELLAAQEEAARAKKEREEAAAKAAAAAAAQAKSQSSARSSGSSGSSGSGTTSYEPSYNPPAPSSSNAQNSGKTGSASAIVDACKVTPSPGGGLCAAWVSNVFVRAGYGFIGGNACDMYANYCYSSDQSAIKPGMIVAVSTHSHTSAGRIYGHIGIYIGNGIMMDNIGYIRTISFTEWVNYYKTTVPPRWGWLGNIVLS